MEGCRRKKKPLSRLAKTFLSYALIAALALPPQAAWATIPEGTMDEDGALAIGVDSSAGHMCTSVGSNALAGLQSSTFGYQANAEGTYSSTFGYQANAEGTYSSAFGYQANAYATNSVALGANSVASEAYTVSVGGNGTTRRIVNVAEGTADTDAATVGQLASLGSEVARIVGGQGLTYDGKSFTGALFNIGGTDYYTIEKALNALYDGTAGSAGGAVGGDEIVIDPGNGAVTIAEGKNIKISKMEGQYVIGVSESPIFTAVYAGRADIGGITVGSDGINMGDKKITGLAEGEITAGSTDAVTGGQLYGLGESVIDALGGSSKFVDGKVRAGIEVGGTAYASVQEALNAVNTGGGTAAANAVQYDDDSKTSVTLNKSGDAVKLTNIADGSIAPGSTDAVTGGQLWNAYKRMDDLNESINIVGAHAAALSGLHPIQYNPYEPTTLSAAVGTYRDEYAVAVGVFHYVRSNVLFNFGASICSDGDVMGRAGVSLAVGKGGRKKPELARDMVGMQQQMIAMHAMLEELKEENAKNKETIKKNEETIKELKEALGKKK